MCEGDMVAISDSSGRDDDGELLLRALSGCQAEQGAEGCLVQLRAALRERTVNSQRFLGVWCA